MDIIWWLIIGGLAGWIGALLMRGRGFGLIGNIIVGIIGAILGGVIFNALGWNLGTFLTALIGSVVLLFIAGLIRQTNTV